MYYIVTAGYGAQYKKQEKRIKIKMFLVIKNESEIILLILSKAIYNIFVQRSLSFFLHYI